MRSSISDGREDGIVASSHDVLTSCHILAFALALNPDKNTSGTVLCPKFQELFVYVKAKDRFCVTELLEMAELRLAQLSAHRSFSLSAKYSSSGIMSRKSSTGWTTTYPNGMPFLGTHTGVTISKVDTYLSTYRS